MLTFGKADNRFSIKLLFPVHSLCHASVEGNANTVECKEQDLHSYCYFKFTRYVAQKYPNSSAAFLLAQLIKFVSREQRAFFLFSAQFALPSIFNFIVKEH